MTALRKNDRTLTVGMGPHTKLPVTAQTDYQEVIPGLTESSGACGSPRIAYHQFSHHRRLLHGRDAPQLQHRIPQG